MFLFILMQAFADGSFAFRFSHSVVGSLEGEVNLPPFQKGRSTSPFDSIEGEVFTVGCLSWHQHPKRQIHQETFHRLHRKSATLYKRSRSGFVIRRMKFVHGTWSKQTQQVRVRSLLRVCCYRNITYICHHLQTSANLLDYVYAYICCVCAHAYVCL